MTNFKKKLQSFYARNPWTSRLSLFFISLIFVAIMVRAILSPLIIQLTTSWLKTRGIDATIEDIRFRIIGGTVTLSNATGTQEGKPLFNIGLIDIHWLWSPLSEKKIEVSHVELDHLAIRIKNYTDTIVIGGVHIPLSSSPETADNNTGITTSKTNVNPWAAALGEVTFSDLDICYLQHSSTIAEASKTNRTMDYCVKLNEMQWNGTISYATDSELLKSNDLPLSSSGDFTLNGLTVTDNILNKTLLDSKLNTLDKVVINSLNDIRVDSLTMNELHAMHRDDAKHKDTFRFSNLTLKKITLRNLDDLSIDSLELKAPGIYAVKNKTDDWEYQQWIPKVKESITKTTPAKQQEPVEKTTPPSDSVFKFAINSINIDDADFCYLDKTTSFYYCYTHKALAWSGPINYGGEIKTQPPVSLSGNLKLTHPLIANNTIGSNLLDIDAVTINKLTVTGQNTRFSDFDIDKFSALQRDKKDDYTVS
ncbi:MAG: hypothetical protein RQ982_00770, partial [Gammaproteobacteria bacterium]|nr:hypothetical protein [Gammaproteobacteria bacterium]